MLVFCTAGLAGSISMTIALSRAIVVSISAAVVMPFRESTVIDPAVVLAELLLWGAYIQLLLLVAVVLLTWWTIVL
jgi:hypothetical protein